MINYSHRSAICLASLGLLLGGCAHAAPKIASAAPKAAPAAAKSPPGFFKVYELDLSQGALPTVAVEGIPNVAKQASVTKEAQGVQVSVEDAGVWRGAWDVGSLGFWAGHQPLNGGERVSVTYSYTGTAPSSAALSLQYTGAEVIPIAGDLVADGKSHTLEFTLPADAKGKHLGTLYLRLDNGASGRTAFLLQKFWWDRPYVDNRLDADKILQTSTPHDTRVQPVNGQMAITVDGRPITGLGWTSLVLQNTGDPAVNDLVGKTGFQLARVNFTLGEQTPYLGLYPPSWLGPNQYDFSYLDQQMARIQKANPQTKAILSVALDGAQWWVWLHPNAAGVDAAHGVPDYLSPEWRRDSRDAIRQMVAHVQTSPYKDAVIGYQLMNGSTEDCGFPVDWLTPPAVARYHAFLRAKYHTDEGLQAAWHNPRATIASAVVGTPTEPLPATDWKKPGALGQFPLLLEPAVSPELQDKITFLQHSYQQVIINFAKDLKEATHNRVIVGAREGDLMGNLWDWPAPLRYQQQPIDELMDCPQFDYFEVQEPYFGRGIGDYGSGATIQPPQGMMAHNKLVMIQNDVRPYIGSDKAFGYTPDLPTTIQMQRRIFANALVRGTPEYLWQQSYSYDDPDMIADFRKMEDINLRAFHAPRDTGAEIAFVYDANYRKYFGYDPLKDAPSRGEGLFDYHKYTWARAGAPYDMIFLDKLAEAKPYKVYVFVETVGLTDAQRALIKKVVRQKGRVGVFFWADGLIDGNSGRINLAKMNDLVGMKIALSPQLCNWKMSPTPWFQQKTGVDANSPMGTLAINEPSELSAPDDTYAPSFSVADPSAQPLATYDAGNPLAGATGVAVKNNANYTSLYSASPTLSPALLRWALARASAFSYTNTADNCYINQSFIGMEAQQTPPPHTVHISLPKPSALYEVFRDQELPANTAFDIPVGKGQTYLYFRGSKAQWEALGRKVGQKVSERQPFRVRRADKMQTIRQRAMEHRTKTRATGALSVRTAS